MSPWIVGRVSSTDELLFSSSQSLPRVYSITFVCSDGVPAVLAPVRAAVTEPSVNGVSPLQGATLQVSMLRFTTLVGADGSLPRRSTSPAPPFSTTPPSGRSLKVLFGLEVQRPALMGEKSQ